MNFGPRMDFQTFDELLRWRAAEHGQRRLFTFLADGEAEAGHITFGELDRRARVVAAHLQARSQPGERALLLYAPGLDYVVGFFGCLYAGLIAVPAYPPDPKRLRQTLPRLRVIAADARVSLILSTRTIMRLARLLFVPAPELAALPWLATDALKEVGPGAWQALSPDGTRIAFLQYTSGSTRTPKGVMLSHHNLMHNSAWIAATMESTQESCGCIWLPPYHDMGLIGGILQPIYRGFPCVLMSPVDFLKHPMRWLRAISRYRSTISGGPNFAYDLCARKFDPARERVALDLSCWQVAFNGAEPIRSETLDRFVEAFGPWGFRREAFWPCYGLAEGTLIASGAQCGEGPTSLEVDPFALGQGQRAGQGVGGRTTRLVSSGRSAPEQELIVVEVGTLRPAAPLQVGEVWLRGPSVAQGYWNRPEETLAAFGARLATTHEGPFLRTGDLGFVADGQLYITGRLKDLMIIRGQNHYPQDIELTVERSHPGLRPGCGAAFSIEVAGEERAVVVQEVSQVEGLDGPAVIERIRQAVAEAHELEVHAVVLLKPRTIFKTSSGKIQRSACRQALLDHKLPAVVAQRVFATQPPAPAAPRDGLPGLLASAAPDQRRKLLRAHIRQQIAAVLGLRPESLDAAVPLSAYGFSSQQALELSVRFEDSTGRDLPATLVYDYPTIDALCAYLLGEQPEAAHSPAAATADSSSLRAEIAPLSDEQAEAELLRELRQLGK